MKNRTLLILVLSLTAIMLFFVMLVNGRETSQEREAALQASASALKSAMSGSVKAVDDEIMDPETPLSLKYSRYPITFVYFVVNKESIPVYSSPNSDKHVIRNAENREKLNYLETVTIENNGGAGTANGQGSGGDGQGLGGGAAGQDVPNDSKQQEHSGEILTSAAEGEDISVDANAAAGAEETWYHIYWYENAAGELLPDGSAEGAEKRFGFIPQGSAEKRRIRLDAMAEYVERAEALTSGGGISHIVNYKNGNGKAPFYKGQEKDEDGTQRSQSAPGYPFLSNREEFSYLEDGTLVKILDPAVAADGTIGESGGTPAYRRVMSLKDEKTYFVPIKYIPYQESLSELKKVVVIDRRNQNEAAFEKIDGVWSCVSYSLATTGTKNQYAAPTPLGFFLMIEKRPQFYYLKDGTDEIQGYAPYVMRFCGGAYIHGVAVSYKYQNGVRITPPIQEYSPTMGTVPLSHKCVRNYTSHAKFLYDWYEEGKTAVIVME